MDVRIEDDELVFGDGGLRVSFKRTLRLPDDGKKYPLPPGLGNFPIRRVEDYASRVPKAWRAHGGVFLPMYQREAMWLSFRGSEPAALQVGVGKVCAVSGLPWIDANGWFLQLARVRSPGKVLWLRTRFPEKVRLLPGDAILGG